MNLPIFSPFLFLFIPESANFFTGSGIKAKLFLPLGF